MSRRRVLLVTSVPLAAPWNGADKNLARLLALRDEQNDYIVQSDREEPWLDERIQVVRDRTTSPLPGTRQKLRALSFLLRHTRQADLIHIVASIARPNPLVGPLLRLWKRVSGRPLVHTALSVGDGPVRASRFPGDATVVISEFDRDRLSHAGLPVVERLMPVLDFANLEPTTPPESLQTRMQLGQRAILYPGHYGPDGGLSQCVEAFARLPDTLDDAVLVLACRVYPQQNPDEEARRAGDLARALGVADRVRILGEVDDILALIAACALTVLVPSRLHGKMAIPQVLLESLALGRPIITSARPPLNEALFGGGLAVEAGDIPDLAAAISRLLTDTALREQLGVQGAEAVRQQCTPERAVREYQQIYQRVWGHER